MPIHGGCSDPGASAVGKATTTGQIFDRQIEIAQAPRTVRHSWRKHTRGWYLTSTLLAESGQNSRVVEGSVVPQDSEVLLRKAAVHAQLIQARAAKIRPRTNSSGGVSRKRKTADAELSQSTAGALAGGTRRDPAARTRGLDASELAMRRADLLRRVDEDPVAKEQILSSVATPGAAEAVARAALYEINMREITTSLEALRGQCRTERGRVAYQIALATVAGTGEHSCGDDNASYAGITKRAESFGVRFETFKDAQGRMKRARYDLHPDEAFESGLYIYDCRKKRSDATDPDCLNLARRFWHNGDVSRATGNSGDRDMWRASKAKGAEAHPRRQIMVNGDDVYKMFLKSPDYLAFKKKMLAQDSSFADPSRTTFLETRCGCLVDPTTLQCACQIHTQQALYLSTLRWLWGSVHTNCECECNWCDGQGCMQWRGMSEDVSTFSEALACEKVNLLSGDPDGFTFMGRKPECAAMKCTECGFGKPNGIPTDCKALQGSAERLVGWIRFQDQTTETGQVHKKQQIPVVGKLGELWEEFMRHSVKVNGFACCEYGLYCIIPALYNKIPCP